MVRILLFFLAVFNYGSYAYDIGDSQNIRIRRDDVQPPGCSADQKAVVERCFNLYNVTNDVLQRFEPKNLLFADPTQLDLLKKVCTDYDQILSCEEMLDSSAIKACLNESIRDGLIYTFTCELLLPLADDTINIECWNKTASCDPSVGMELNARTDKRNCNILLSAYRQFKCIQKRQEGKCVNPDEEIIQRTLGETLYLIAENECAIPIEETTIATEAPLAERRETAVKEADNCKTLQQYDPVFCLDQMSIFNEYFQQIMYKWTVDNQWFESSVLQQLCNSSNPIVECFKAYSNNGTYGCFVANLGDKLMRHIGKICRNMNLFSIKRRSVCEMDQGSSGVADPCYSDNEAHTAFGEDESGSMYELCSVADTVVRYARCVSSHESPGCSEQPSSDIGHITSSINEIRKNLQCIPENSTSDYSSDQLDGQVITVVLNETLNLPMVNCTPDDTEQYEKCFLNFTRFGFHPISVIDNVNEIDQACVSFNQFFKCRRKIKCRPPVDGGIHNMFYYVCGTRIHDFKRQSDCLSSMSNTEPVTSCIKNSSFTINQLVAMSSEQLCQATGEVINCTNRRVERRCGVDSADFQFLLLQSFAKGINLSCPIDSRPKVKESLIAFPINCTEQEEVSVKICTDQFNGMTEKLKDLVSKGLPHVLKSVDALNQVFYDGCAKMRLFDQCWNSSINHDSNCKISSCLINVGLSVCTSNDGEAPLRDQLKCAFSLVAEPEFNKCFMAMPKNVWNDPAQMADLFPKFIACIREPLTKKCGENAVRLVRSLINEVLVNPYDSSCIVNFQSLREPFNSSSNVHLICQQLEEPISIPSLEEQLNSRNMTLYPQLESSRPICSTPEFINQGSCHHLFLLADVDMEIIFINSPYLLPNLCSHLSEFTNCTQTMSCRYPDNESWENLLTAACGAYRTEMIEIGKCLTDLSRSGKLDTCNRRKARPGRAHCPWGGTFYPCAIPKVAIHCSVELAKTMRILYSIYSRPYGNDCILDDVLICPEEEKDIETVITSPSTLSEHEKPFCDGTTISERESCWSVYPSEIHVHELFINSSQSRHQICQLQPMYAECVRNASCRMGIEEAIESVLFIYCNWPWESFQEISSCLSEQLMKPENDSCRDSLNILLNSPFQYDGNCPFENLRNLLICTTPSTEAQCTEKAVTFVNTLYNTLVGRFASECTLPISEVPLIEIETNVKVDMEQTTVAVSVQPVCSAVGIPAEETIEDCLSIYDNGIRLGRLLLDSKYEFPDLCRKLEDFINCTDRQYCRTVRHDSLRDLMSRFCKLEAATFNPIATCTKSFHATQMELSEGHPNYCEIQDPYLLVGNEMDRAEVFSTTNGSCPVFGETLQCMSPGLAQNCSFEALKLMYELYNAYANWYGPSCVLDVEKVDKPPESCTAKDDKAFYACEEELFKYGMHRVVFLDNPGKSTKLCIAFTGQYRNCLSSLTCAPEPYTKAFQYTMSFLCFNETIRTTYAQSGACLASTTDSIAGKVCDLNYDDIIWSGTAGPRGNACSKMNEILSCIAKAVLEPCGDDSVKFLYLVNGIFMEQYDPTCVLQAPELITTATLPSMEKSTTTVEEKEGEGMTDETVEETTTGSFDGDHDKGMEATWPSSTDITDKTTPEPILEKTTPAKKSEYLEFQDGEPDDDDVDFSGCAYSSWNMVVVFLSCLLAISINFVFKS